MEQAIQIPGALCILAAFIAAQFGKLDANSWAYLLLNLVGAAALAIVAFWDEDWGFVLLEGVWTVVSAWGVVKKLRPTSRA